jgi:hypothetical protein
MDDIDLNILKSYILQCKKISTNFTEQMLGQFKKYYIDTLCTEDGQLDKNKFSSSQEYFDTLFSFFIYQSMQNANNVYNKLHKLYTDGAIQQVEQKHNKPSVKLPAGWSVISGGKQKNK